MSVTPYLLKEALRSQAEPSFHRPSDPRLTQGASPGLAHQKSINFDHLRNHGDTAPRS